MLVQVSKNKIYSGAINSCLANTLEKESKDQTVLNLTLSLQKSSYGHHEQDNLAWDTG